MLGRRRERVKCELAAVDDSRRTLGASSFAATTAKGPNHGIWREIQSVAGSDCGGGGRDCGPLFSRGGNARGTQTGWDGGNAGGQGSGSDGARQGGGQRPAAGCAGRGDGR